MVALVQGTVAPLALWRSDGAQFVTLSTKNTLRYAVISKLNFSWLFRQAWVQAVTPEVISSGICKAGVYPMDRAQISILKEKDQGSEQQYYG